MAMVPPPLAASPLPLPDELFEEIFFRLPPEDPSCLLRASLVCKHWRDLISRPRFLRHLHAHRRAPQMLGFLQNSSKGRLPVYVPTSPFPFPFPDRGAWKVLGYRHGRAVFSPAYTDSLLLVWEPLTGERWEVPVPADFRIQHDNASVLCAADGCDHLNCHGGPFRIVLVFCDPDDDETERVTSACVYSSETGAWGELALRKGFSLICERPGLLVGDSLLYFLSIDGYILEYDLARHALDVIRPPDHDADSLQRVMLMLVQAEEGGLGIVEADDEGWNLLHRWSWDVSKEGAAQWVEHPVMYLDESLPYVARTTSSVTLMGFVEGANTILVSTDAGFFTVKLHSKRARKVCKNRSSLYPLVPIVSSYILGSTLEEHHDLRSPDFSDEADGEEPEKAEALKQAELLFYKGSMAFEKGDFVGAVDSLGHFLTLRLGFYSQRPFSTPNHAEAACMRMYCGKII